jgi:hypothetical protein
MAGEAKKKLGMIFSQGYKQGGFKRVIDVYLHEQGQG